jgi:hypothetical protein
MQRSALPVTRYASPVTAPCAPNAQTVEIAFILLRQFENMRGMRDCKDVFNIVKMQRFVCEFKLLK